MSEETKRPSPQVRKKKNPWFGRIGWIFGLVGLATAVVYVSLPKPIEVEAATVTSEEFVVTVDEDGVTRVTDRYVISAPLAGQLARIELDPGALVKQGDVVARLLPARAPLLDARTRSEAEARVLAAAAGVRQAEAQTERAQAAREFAEREAKTNEKLASQGVIHQLELERSTLDRRSREAELSSAQFATRVARHELAMAQAALGRLDGKVDDGDQFLVTSPVGGRILKVIRESEGIVQAGSPLLEVGDPHALEIAADVLTSDAVHIQPGAPVSVEEWGGAALSGAVRQIEPSAFTRVSALGVEEQRVNVVVDLKSPFEEWRALGDGYRVETRIQIYRKEGALVVPWSSLFRRSGKWALFVIEAGRAKIRPVDVGRRNERAAEIQAGVALGEKVVLHPSDKVQDGVELAF